MREKVTKYWKLPLILIFIILEVVLFTLFINADLNLLPGGNELRYASTLVMVAFSLILFRRSNYFYSFLIAMAAIGVADYFLLFTPEFKLGIMFFIVAQASIYYFLEGDYWVYLVPGALVLLLVLSHSLEGLASVYASLLLTNFITSIILAYKRRSLLLAIIPIAYLCLILCDTMILIRYQVGGSGILIWVFYQPFLILLPLGALVKLGNNVHPVGDVN